MGDRLEQMYQDINGLITTQVASVNSYSAQIAELNQRITIAQSSINQPPNDLMDQRDQLISDIRSEVEQQTRTTYMKAFVLMPATLNDEAVQQLPSRYFDAAASAADGKD